MQVYLHYPWGGWQGLLPPGGCTRSQPGQWKCLKGKEPNQIQSELIEACGKEHGWSETALRSIEPIRTGAEQEISQVLGYVLFLHCHQPGSRILHHWDSPGVGQEFSTRSTTE